MKIDVHSHILPAVDDGSRSVEESLSLLKELSLQGVDVVAATPHFYADVDSPEDFLQRRTVAWEQLKEQLSVELPQVRLGAEVLYFDGISSMKQLPQLRLERTPLLLLEMPMNVWSKRTIQEVLSIQYSGECTVLLAHIERYFKLQKRSVWDELREHGVKMQVNADGFLSWRSRASMLKLLDQGYAQFIASDCHGMKRRPPQLDAAWKVVERKLGSDCVNFLQGQADQYFPAKEPIR